MVDGLSRHSTSLTGPLSSARNYLHVKRTLLAKSTQYFASLSSTVTNFWILRRGPPKNNLNVDVLTWLLSSSADHTIIDEAVRAVAGLPSSSYLQEALYDSHGYMVLAQGLFDHVKRSPGSVKIDDERLVGAHLHALLHAVQHTKPDQSFDKLASLVQPGGPLHRWEDLRPGLRIIAYCVQSFIKNLCNISDGPGEDYHAEMDILLEAGIQPHHWQSLANAVVLRMNRGGSGERARGVVVLRRLAQQSAGIARWVDGPIVPDDLRQALARVGVVGLLSGLLTSDDDKIAMGAMEALYELAGHGMAIAHKVMCVLTPFQFPFVLSLSSRNLSQMCSRFLKTVTELSRSVNS